jgi:serine phosphatase RsbU (regulator of sigma subunit)
LKNRIFYIILFSLFININGLFAQKMSDNVSDSIQSHQLIQKAKKIFENDQLTAKKYIETAIRLAEKNKNKRLIFDAQIELFEIYNKAEDNEQAINLLLDCIGLANGLNDEESLALVYNNLGATYVKMALWDKALEYFKKAHQINLKSNNYNGLKNTLNNIGAIYYYQDNEEEAYNYFEESLQIERKINNKEGIALSLGNLAGMLLNDKLFNPSKAKVYLNEAEKICLANADYYTLAIIYNNLGKFYEVMKHYDFAIQTYQKAYDINDSLNKTDSKILSLYNISYIYEIKGDYKKALKYNQEAQELSDNYFSSENNKMLTELETKYQAKEKQIENEMLKNNKKINELEINRQKDNITAQRMYIIIGFIIVLILSGASIILIRNVREKKKINKTLSDQNIKIEHQHHLLEEKQKEIIDSITYAKRIQNAILPPNKIVQQHLKESFIYYQPKDIVAGDFYWIESVKDKVLFAVADCTGHGVPGAMVSVVCNNALNRSVREYGLTDPGKILDKTREIVVEEFAKSDEEVKDGMDIALCSIQNNQLMYSGAHNPLWIIRDNDILEIKANKQPIGQFENPVSFESHIFQLEEGDSIYIFSDGYCDQFGGEKGKKFKAANFKKLLLSIQQHPMKKQLELVNDTFENWKGDLEQLDDVCIIGVKI